MQGGKEGRSQQHLLQMKAQLFSNKKTKKKSWHSFNTNTKLKKRVLTTYLVPTKKNEAITLHMKIGKNYVKVNCNKYFFLMWLHVFFPQAKRWWGRALCMQLLLLLFFIVATTCEVYVMLHYKFNWVLLHKL